MTNKLSPEHILKAAFDRAQQHAENPIIADETLVTTIAYVTRATIGAGVRLLLACALAKAHTPAIDIRKPFTNLGDRSYSGRRYDENFVTGFIRRHELPCNVTTAFLTPALRTKVATPLLPGTDLGGRDRRLYDAVIELLHHVEEGHLDTHDLLAETVRQILMVKHEREQRIASLLRDLKQTDAVLQLSSEDIVTLIQQHLSLPGAARLPVLAVAAAYQAVGRYWGEHVLPLQSHTAADQRTGALGDVEITLTNDDRVRTTYEMKARRVSKDDLYQALQKLRQAAAPVDNYIFITTEPIDHEVADYAKTLYRETGGIEFAVLDCIGFLRHFLHLFHRLRHDFLDTYQALLLAEPDSGVREALKEAFLAMRRATEASYTDDNAFE